MAKQRLSESVKETRRRKAREYALLNKHKKREYDRQYREANREKIRASKAEYVKRKASEIKAKKAAYYQRNMTVRRASARDYHYRSKYGITYDQYRAICIAQNGTCLICGARPQRLVIDHNHATGLIRGAICGPCNSGIGLLKESISTLRSAISYLTNEAGRWIGKVP
jgi:hypothetical protein